MKTKGRFLLRRFAQWFLFASVAVSIAPVMAETKKAEAENKTSLNPDAQSPVKIHVNGAYSALGDNMKAHLPSRRHLNCQSSKADLMRFVDASIDKLQEGAEAMGHFGAKYTLEPTRTDQCWVLNLNIKSGKAVRVRSMNIRIVGAGRALPAFKELQGNLPYKTHDVLVTQKYEDYKSALARAASQYGFFDAEFKTRQITVNIDQHVADIVILFDTGQRYQFGQVDMEQSVLRPNILNRYLRIKPGEPYDAARLIEQQRLLTSSGYYKDVDISSQFSKAKGRQVPIQITAKRKKRYRYSARLGYATDSGAQFEGNTSANWVNTRGHKLDARFRIAENDPKFGFTYKVHLWQPEYEFTSLAVDWERSDNDSIQSDKTEMELSYNRRNKSLWQQVAYISLLDEKTKVVSQLEDRTQFLILGGRVSKTERDDSLFPTEGWRLEAEVKGGSDAVGSDASFVRGEIKGKYLISHSVGKLIWRGGMGSLWTENFDVLPKSLRFFAGGQSSVRGYGFEKISATDAEGNRVGAKHYVTKSLELERHITGNFSGAVFVDTGSAFNEKEDFDLQTGMGIGVRYRSPLGPIRFDLAVPEEDTSDYHLYFSLGPDL